jgi:hypothetical protein
VRQLAQIERRQARIRRIRQKMAGLPASGMKHDHLVNDPEVHHHIGAAENHAQHLGSFLKANSGDPAIAVGLLRLRLTVLGS